eukprot:268715-Pelagomonas_calceolata.AAC.1
MDQFLSMRHHKHTNTQTYGSLQMQQVVAKMSPSMQGHASDFLRRPASASMQVHAKISSPQEAESPLSDRVPFKLDRECSFLQGRMGSHQRNGRMGSHKRNALYTTQVFELKESKNGSFEFGVECFTAYIFFLLLLTTIRDACPECRKHMDTVVRQCKFVHIEEEYGVGYVYGPEASNADITARSIQPLLRKFLEGYNTTVIVFGATGAGKTTSLEGGKAKDSIKNSDQGDGLVHLAIDELFRMINHKAAAVGECNRMFATRAVKACAANHFTGNWQGTCVKCVGVCLCA